MKEIEINRKGKTVKAFCDDADFENFKNFNWWVDGSGYPMTRTTDKLGKKTYIPKRMHSFVFLPIRGFDVDHINGNKLDNTRGNLRQIPHWLNIFNNNSLGVYRRKSGRWSARVVSRRKVVGLGTHDSKQIATEIRDKYKQKIFDSYFVTLASR